MAVGGDLEEARYNHPTLGQGFVTYKAGEESTYDTGGIESADDDAAVDGQGTMIDTMSRVRPYFKGVAVNDMDVQTLEKMKALAASPVPATWVFSCINGVSYKLLGKPVGKLEANVLNSTFDLKVSGSGTATQIV